mmetsp:Transcript_53861/g.155531  ORF Transcript_53861/g.155531 Transcript_53861/m.155531 type:complete len:290 (+) Transcript_53861:575-1444(+)
MRRSPLEGALWKRIGESPLVSLTKPWSPMAFAGAMPLAYLLSADADCEPLILSKQFRMLVCTSALMLSRCNASLANFAFISFSTWVSRASCFWQYICKDSIWGLKKSCRGLICKSFSAATILSCKASTLVTVVFKTTSLALTLASKLSAKVQARCAFSATAISFSLVASRCLAKSISTAAHLRSRTRVCSTTAAKLLEASSRDRAIFASRLWKEVSKSFAKRAKWFSRPTTSSRTALLNSSARRCKLSSQVRFSTATVTSICEIDARNFSLSDFRCVMPMSAMPPWEER